MKCYFKYPANEKGERKQCESDINAEFEYWCTGAHKRDWQNETYGKPRPPGVKNYSILEIQNRLKAKAHAMRQEKDGLFAK